MKKLGLSLLCLIFYSSALPAATLHHIRFADYPEKIRLVFDFDEEIIYNTQESRQKIELFFPDTQAGPDIPSFVEVNDLVISYVGVEKDGTDLKIEIPLFEPVDYDIFFLNNPPRLVIDFDRKFINVVYGGTVCEGLDSFMVKKGTDQGQIFANVLKLDLTKVKVKPALARKAKPQPLEGLIGALFPWGKPLLENEHFYLDKLSNIVEYHHALAGVNGTFFAPDGSPLGALIIDRELISSPIYDRTAFFLDENNQPFIDNVFVTSAFVLNDQTRFEITGINQPPRENDLIMYTPIWGKATGLQQDHVELVVQNNKIVDITAGHSTIPENGYVLALFGNEAEIVRTRAQLNQTVETHIKVVPFTTAPQQIIYLVAGGPRLLKQGQSYVSKHEEKFKADVAQRRAARTAVGIINQHELLLVTVDGPGQKNNSLGVTLEELAELLASLGAVEAMNLDGGSSSTMVIKGKIVNRTVGGGQRGISNALVVWPHNR